MNAVPDLAKTMPSFLKRTKENTPMPDKTPTQTPARAPKQKRKDAYVIDLKVTVEIDMQNSESLIAAIKAGEDAKAPSSWPDGAKIECKAGMTKV